MRVQLSPVNAEIQDELKSAWARYRKQYPTASAAQEALSKAADQAGCSISRGTLNNLVSRDFYQGSSSIRQDKLAAIAEVLGLEVEVQVAVSVRLASASA